jgi:hypothetical protein
MCSGEFKTPILYIVLKYRNGHTMMIYFQVLNYNEQHKRYTLIFLAPLLANSTLIGYVAMVSVRFS